MNKPESPASAFTYVGIAVSIAAALLGIAYFIATTVQADHREDTKRVTACAESGGSWINYYDMCLQSGSAVEK